MNQHNNINNALTSARISQSRALHPYTRALSRDALLDEIDDRQYAGSELEEVEELFSLREQGHGLTPGSA